jgi:hypothetical protein
MEPGEILRANVADNSHVSASILATAGSRRHPRLLRIQFIGHAGPAKVQDGKPRMLQDRQLK